MSERWAPVLGFDGLYDVSTLGRVRSVARIVFGKKKQTVASRILSIQDNGNGYKSVRLWKGNQEFMRYVHRLALESFVGPCPAGQEGAHRDGCRGNNTLGNLRWDTKPGNHNDKRRHGTLRNGELARAAKLTSVEVIEIRQMLASGTKQQDVSERFGISQPTVSDISTRRTWHHI